MDKIWRFVRIAKPGWTARECALMTGAAASYLHEVLCRLADMGFIVRAGIAESREIRYRATALAQVTPETPRQTSRPRLPYGREREAVLTIVRKMMTLDSKSRGDARAIADAAQILVDTFGAIAAGAVPAGIAGVSEETGLIVVEAFPEPESIAEAGPETVTQNENV